MKFSIRPSRGSRNIYALEWVKVVETRESMEASPGVGCEWDGLSERKETVDGSFVSQSKLSARRAEAKADISPSAPVLLLF
jgi:hypothetical protein